jgi:endonuclease III
MAARKLDADQFFSRLSALNPNPRGELAYINPFTLLVAVVLSAQATDVSVNKATVELFKLADTPQKMLALGEERLKGFIKTIGLFNTKAKNVIALSRILIDRYDGEVPADREKLQELPGVGRKTANVVLNIAFAQPTMAVDTHIFRLCNRTGLAPGKTPDAVEQALEKNVPERWKLHAHHWLILHGRYICKARKPDCPRCVLIDLCGFKDKTSDAPAVPAKKPKPKKPAAPKRKAAVRPRSR